MADFFASFGDEPSTPVRAPHAITKSDAVALPAIPRGIYVGGGDDGTLRGLDAAADVRYRNLPDTGYIPLRTAYVRATGTTAIT